MSDYPLKITGGITLWQQGCDVGFTFPGAEDAKRVVELWDAALKLGLPIQLDMKQPTGGSDEANK